MHEWYDIYVIGDSTRQRRVGKLWEAFYWAWGVLSRFTPLRPPSGTGGVLISNASWEPKLPAGYDCKRRIGWARPKETD